MTVRIIEARTRDTEVWTPIAVGNASGAQGIRYIAQLPRVDVKTRAPEFKTLSFNKDGGVSEAETYRRQLNFDGTSPQLMKMAKALNVELSQHGWRTQKIERMSLRLVSFAGHTDLNAYLLKHAVKPVVSGTEATIVAEVVLPQGEQTVSELYQTLGKMIATDPKVASAKAIVAAHLTEFKLTDDQVQLLQRNIQAALIKNAGQNIASRLEAQANIDIAKLYNAFDVKNPPVIKLTSEILPAVPKANK